MVSLVWVGHFITGAGLGSHAVELGLRFCMGVPTRTREVDQIFVRPTVSTFSAGLSHPEVILSPASLTGRPRYGRAEPCSGPGGLDWAGRG